MDYLKLDQRFKEGSADVVYSCHSLEHCSYPNGVTMFFIQVIRVLKSGGTLRLVVPDLMKVAKKYVAGEDLRDVYDGEFYAYKDCPAERFMYFARGWSHTVLFDERLLRTLMQDAGFVNIRVMPFGESDIPELCGLDRFQSESLVMEAQKL